MEGGFTKDVQRNGIEKEQKKEEGFIITEDDLLADGKQEILSGENPLPDVKEPEELSIERRAQIFVAEYEQLCARYGLRLVPDQKRIGSDNNGFGMFQQVLTLGVYTGENTVTVG